MQYDHGTIFNVSSIYQLHIGIGDKMIVNPIDKHNSGVELSSITMSNNMFGLCAKATVDCPDRTNQDYRVTVISSDATNVFS
ncbi:hypothetical protein IMAU10566_02932 [Lactiplantibacillus plantarum]|nr:hypothetical protein [Lactiplantibacillus plantarum]